MAKIYILETPFTIKIVHHFKREIIKRIKNTTLLDLSGENQLPNMSLTTQQNNFHSWHKLLN